MAESKELTFAEAVARLETIVDELEHGDVPLEQSFQLFEEGVQLARVCTGKLNEAEKKIEKLSREGLDQLKTTPLEDLDEV